MTRSPGAFAGAAVLLSMLVVLSACESSGGADGAAAPPVRSATKEKPVGDPVPLSAVAVPSGIANLSVVVAGSADGLQPAQLLNAPRLQRVIGDTEAAFDLVIFDTPPIISVADAMNLAPHCDGVLLVVRAGAVTPAGLQRAARQIQHVNGKVLGVLLNRVDLRRGDVEYYRHYRAYHGSAARK